MIKTEYFDIDVVNYKRIQEKYCDEIDKIKMKKILFDAKINPGIFLFRINGTQFNINVKSIVKMKDLLNTLGINIDKNTYFFFIFSLTIYTDDDRITIYQMNKKFKKEYYGT